MRNRQVGPAGIDVDRRNVDLNLGREFLEIKAADSVGPEAYSSFEFYRNPFGVVANL